MKYLKNVLLAAGMVATTMGMSFSANAVLIQQDIYLDVDVTNGEYSDDTNFGISETLSQLIGSISYYTQDADIFGEIGLDDISVTFNLGLLTLTQDDALLGGPAPIVLSANPKVDGIENFIMDFDFMFNGVDFALTTVADINFGGAFWLDDISDISNPISVVYGTTRLGSVNVSEPSALILMLAGVGFLVRRRIATK
jgi:hypothetical protein